MNWNAKPKSPNLPPIYPKGQASILQQYLVIQQPPTTSHSSLSYPISNQEACMFSSNSNSVSQPLPNFRNYKAPQIHVSNTHNRTVVTSQTKVERITYGNVKGPQQPTQSLQMSSGVMQNVWLNSAVRNSMSSHTEAAVSQTDFGANTPYIHVPQSQLVTSDTYSVQPQMTSSNSVRGSVTPQGNQGLSHSLADQLIDWAQQYTSNEQSYPDYRAPPQQYSYLPQNLLQDPTVQKQSIIPTSLLQPKNNQLSTSAQTLQSKHSAPVSLQYAMETNIRPPPPYNCRYGSQPGQTSQPVVKHLPVEVPQSSEMHFPEKRKDLCKGFQQQWLNSNENSNTIGNPCDFNVSASVKQPYNEAVRSVDGVPTPAQSNQEKSMYSCNPSANQVLDTKATKEKLVRDIKSLVEMKKKFSALARKIKINKSLLMAAGCSKTANNSYGEPAQHSDFSTKGVPAKSDNHCSMELLETCLSLWKNQSPKTTGEKSLKSSEEEQCSESGANTAAFQSSKHMEVQSLCSVEGNSQNKMVNPSQTVLSVATQNYEPSGVGAAKGTELQVAVVSPLILSNVKAFPVKVVAPVALPEPLYPVVKEGSVCSLQNQVAESTAVAVALDSGAKEAVASSPAAAQASLPVEKKRQCEPVPSNPQTTTDASLGKLPPRDDLQTLPKPRDSTVVSGHTLQIENICSLAEGDVSYNSQIAEIFNSFPLKNVKPQKPLPPSQQLTSSQQKEQVGPASDSTDFGFRKDKSVQCTGVPQDVTEQPKLLQSLELPLFGYVEANTEVLEESNLELTTNKESTTKDVCCSPAVAWQDTCPQETEVYLSDLAQVPTGNEMRDGKEPVSYLHDQLSELLKEFPYGIEAVPKCEGSVGRQKAGQILESQTCVVSDKDTDQIQITVLSSEQIKELFPEDVQPCDIDKLAEPEKEKVVEVGSLCDPQATRRVSCDPVMLDAEKDKIHCCALGWLSKVYEGVPQCQCGSTKSALSSEERGDKLCSPLETNNCKQVDRHVTIVEFSSATNNPKTPLTSSEKSQSPEVRGINIKTAKIKRNSSKRIEKEIAKCDSKDPGDVSKIKQGDSLKPRQNVTGQIASKSDEPDPLNNKGKKHLKFQQATLNSCNATQTFSEQASRESLQKQVPQNSDLPKAQRHLLPKKDLCRKNGALILSASPENKRLKFKAGGSKLKYFEKRKTDHGIIPDLEIKKKKYEKEQNKNVGGTPNLCNTLTNPSEKASVDEKTVSNSESSDLKGRSSKTRVITVAEYLQRQKNKDAMMNASKKTYVESMPCDSERVKSSKLHAPMSWEKVIQRYGSSTETSRELVHTLTSNGKNLKVHQAVDSTTCSISRNVKGIVDGKQPDKALIDKTKSNVDNDAESCQVLPQSNEQRKSYLNRVAFKCTERESIYLTKLDSAPQKLSKDDEKNHECTPKTDAMEKTSMLEFKLCPDMLLKTPSSVDKQDNPALGPGKDEAPVRVSGMKSTKEDWLKYGSKRTTMPETNQEIDNANPRLPKRNISADGFETRQNPAKDSNTMFQTYKQMYLEKRSKSLGSSPVK